MIVNKNWFFQSVPTQDRFVQRVFPNQSDRPSEATFQNLVDTMAEEVDMIQAQADIVNLDTRVTALEVVVPTKADLSYVDAQLLLKADQSDLTILETRVDTAELDIIDLQNTKADALWVQANYVNNVTHNNDISQLQINKLDTNVFNNYRDNVVNPRLNVEHIIFNPKSNGDKFTVPFIGNSKIIIHDIEVRGVMSWFVYAVNGNQVLYNTNLNSTSFNNTSLPRDFKNIDPNADGFMIEATTLQSGQVVPPVFILRVEYIY